MRTSLHATGSPLAFPLSFIVVINHSQPFDVFFQSIIELSNIYPISLSSWLLFIPYFTNADTLHQLIYSFPWCTSQVTADQSLHHSTYYK